MVQKVLHQQFTNIVYILDDVLLFSYSYFYFYYLSFVQACSLKAVRVLLDIRDFYKHI